MVVACLFIIFYFPASILKSLTLVTSADTLEFIWSVAPASIFPIAGCNSVTVFPFSSNNTIVTISGSCVVVPLFFTSANNVLFPSFDVNWILLISKLLYVLAFPNSSLVFTFGYNHYIINHISGKVFPPFPSITKSIKRKRLSDASF